MEITNVSEYEAIAKQKLPKMVFDYYASGAEDQWTLQENRNAFSRILWDYSFTVVLWYFVIRFFLTRKYIIMPWNLLDKNYRFRPRILIDVSKIDMMTTVLGFKISMPIMIAPTAMQKMAHPEGILFFVLYLLSFFFLLTWNNQHNRIVFRCYIWCLMLFIYIEMSAVVVIFFDSHNMLPS